MSDCLSNNKCIVAKNQCYKYCELNTHSMKNQTNDSEYASTNK